MEIQEKDVRNAFEKGCDEVKEVLSNMFPQLFKSTAELGDRFVIDEHEYILARADVGETILINLKTGGRWGESVKCFNDCKITRAEMLKLFGSQYNEFKKVS